MALTRSILELTGSMNIRSRRLSISPLFRLVDPVMLQPSTPEYPQWSYPILID